MSALENMIVNFTGTGIVVPTTGRGPSGAQVAIGATGSPVYTATSWQQTTITNFTNIAAGQLVIVETGYWAVVVSKGALQSDPIVVTPWRKLGGITGTNTFGEIPTGSATQTRVFAASVMASYGRFALRSLSATTQTSVAATTLKVYCLDSTAPIATLTVPGVVAATAGPTIPASIYFGESGLPCYGPLLFESSSASTSGLAEFVALN